MLPDLKISHDYRSDRSNLVEESYVPCLRESRVYWRAVGYFTTHGLALAGRGISAFVQNSGMMSLVASPWLEADDIEAIKQGYEARTRVLEWSTERQLADGAIASLPDISLRRLGCIAWLVGEGRLDIKHAMPSAEVLGQGRGLYHEKVGVFFDQNQNAIAFSGSSNETVGGLIGNFESFDVHLSWDDPHGRVARKTEDFKRLWSNQTRNLTVLDFPESARRRLLRLRPPRPDRSAGERQVLSLAFITGMSKVTGEEAPLVMDTPFGRLSSAHREAITEHIPEITDQLVMLVSDEELRDVARENLDPWIGAEYNLEFDQDTGCTNIVEMVVGHSR